MMRPFRFSIMAGMPEDGGAGGMRIGATTVLGGRAHASRDVGTAWATLARRAESLGYDAFMMPDHLGRQLAPIAALATVAAATSQLRIAPFVFANDFRHPLMLAGEAATLDLLSGGRLLLGIGAGWRVTDYRYLGLRYDEPRVRVDRLKESVGIMKRLLAGEIVTHAGEHYQLDRARLAPLPAQQPVPFIIGGGGPRMLRFAAHEADVVGLLPQFDPKGRPIVAQATNGATRAKAALVREAAGNRWGSIDLNVLVFYAGLVGGPHGPMTSALNAAKAAAVSLVGTPYVLHGTHARVREILLRRREAWGLNSYTIAASSMESMAPIVEDLSGR